MIARKIREKVQEWQRDPADCAYAFAFEVDGIERLVWIPDETFVALTNNLDKPAALPLALLHSLLPPESNVAVSVKRIPQDGGEPGRIPLGGVVGGDMLRWYLERKLGGA